MKSPTFAVTSIRSRFGDGVSTICTLAPAVCALISRVTVAKPGNLPTSVPPAGASSTANTPFSSVPASWIPASERYSILAPQIGVPVESTTVPRTDARSCARAVPPRAYASSNSPSVTASRQVLGPPDARSLANEERFILKFDSFVRSVEPVRKIALRRHEKAQVNTAYPNCVPTHDPHSRKSPKLHVAPNFK